MKKLLTFLTLLTLSIGVTWAAEETVDFSAQGYSNQQEITSYTGTNFTITFSQGDASYPCKYYSSGTAIRCYGGSQFAVKSKSSSENITSIVITFGSSDGTNEITTEPATYSNGTWTGDSESVVFSIQGSSGHRKIKALTVTIGGDTPQPTTYSITGTGAVTGGNVTASATSGITAGTNVTITATPSTGYDLSNLTVDGNDVTSSVNSNYQYTFTMPEHDVAVSATFTEQSTPQPSGSNRFERITNVNQLEAGKRYLLVYENGPAVMGAINNGNTKYGLSVPETNNYTYSSGVITLNDQTNAKPLTLGGNATDGWTFSLDGVLLNHTGKSNTLSTGTTNTTWNVSFESNGNAVIENKTKDTGNNTRYIKYNSNSGQLRFACYTSGQQPIQLYKEVAETTTDKLYLIGNSLNGVSPWDLTKGVEMTYNSTAGRYASDVYFDGNGNNGVDYFQFAKGIPTDEQNKSNWDALTGRIGADSNGNYVITDNMVNGDYAMGIRSNTPIESFQIPAGLYTVSVDLTNMKCYVKKNPVTMTINNNTSGTTYFEETATATLASNLTEYAGAKIYYTTDGTDPENSSTRQEYSEAIPITENITIKAIAELNYIKSEVAERTFTKKPKAPTFSPDGGYFHEATQVTISCATPNTVIYYTTNGDTPNNTSTLYEGPVTVIETTTIKAIAYLGDVYGSVASATYTFTGDIEPGENDFILVTNENQLKAGVEYIIVNQVNKMALGTNQKTANREAVSVTLSDENMLATLNDNIQVLTLEGDANGWYFAVNETTQYPNGGYLYSPGSQKRNQLLTSETIVDGSMALISIDNNAKATIAFQVPKQDSYTGETEIEPWYLRYNTSSNGLFSCYDGPSNQLDVYLYYRGDVTPPTPTEMTLRDIILANKPGTLYKISNEDGLLGVYSKGTSVWFKDEEQAVDYQNPTAASYEYYTVVEQNLGINKSEKDFAQNNWIEVVFPAEADYNNKHVKNLTGTYSNVNGNPVLTLTQAVAVEDVTPVPASALAYEPNPYIAANFVGNQQYQGDTYFFSMPKAQEYAQILWAVWDGSKMNMPTEHNAYGFTGSFPIEPDLNISSFDGLQNGKAYNFHAIIRKGAATSGAPKLKGTGDTYVVYPTDLNPQIPTAINGVVVNGNVKSVKYVNVAGVVSDAPFQGVNIVVTEYTDGTRTTSKMLRK